jgi:hypothetical protein
MNDARGRSAARADKNSLLLAGKDEGSDLAHSNPTLKAFVPVITGCLEKTPNVSDFFLRFFPLDIQLPFLYA